MTEQIEKIKKLIATATNPKQKAMYQQLLAKLKSETEIETEPEVQSKTDEVQPVKLEAIKPKKIDEVQVASEPVKPKKIIAPKVKVEPQPSTELETPQEPKEPKPKNESLFQAIGIIKGEVNLGDVSTIKIGDKEYRLFYIPGRRRFAYEALKKEIEATGNTTQRLIVYPKILHFPGRDKPYIIAFQLSGFISSIPTKKEHPFNSELKDFEFRLCGLWQFIPVCRTPCISVFRNFTKDRLAWIKEAEASRKVKFMKATHAPLLWRDSPVKPFRFNPKLEKEQQAKTYFVELKARFLPDRDVFGFVELLSEPTEERPNFFKASKKMKAEALREVEFKRREIEQAPDNEPIETVTNVEVSNTTETLTAPDSQDIPDSQQSTVKEDNQNIPESQQTTVKEESQNSEELTTVGLEPLNPDDLSLNQLKSIVREQMNDDDIKKFGKLTNKTTWIEAYRHLN